MNSIWIVDFGSQYTQLIARVLRELNYKSELFTLEQIKEKIKFEKPQMIILSGGPQSVFEDENDYQFIFDKNLPILGICYGMQLIAQHFGGVVKKGVQGEFGEAKIRVKSELISQEFDKSVMWMSHSDHVIKVPAKFETLLESEDGLISCIKSKTEQIWGLQFHPEVHHSKKGKKLLKFILDNCKIQKNWSSEDIVQIAEQKVKPFKDEFVLCAFSGGVDSLVAAVLCEKYLKENLYCFFVDNGLLRPQDYDHINLLKENLNLNIEIINAADLFLGKLKGIKDPEEKRKIIGRTFIEVFDEKVKEFEIEKNIKFTHLLQGTLYPDVIESVSPHKKGGKSVTIKSHHNVGGLPEKMGLKLLEPFRELFKDEVRIIGKQLKLKEEWINRHPFPGPGLGIRVLGEITEKKIKAVQESDRLLFEELKKADFYNSCWQSATIYLPVPTVGVKGDGRVVEEVICVRIVESRDGMTAKASRVPYELLERISSRITNEVKGITRVVYDVTSKPPGTIEWE